MPITSVYHPIHDMELRGCSSTPRGEECQGADAKAIMASRNLDC